MVAAVVRSFTPHPHQRLMIDFMLANPRCAVWCFMGGGKSSATLSVCDALLLAGAVKKPLVLAPLRVARSTWPGEAQKWQELSHLKIQPILGSVEERTEALNTPADVYTMNYDNLVWLVEKLDGKWPFDMVVADESTRLKNFRIKQGGRRTQALSLVAHKRVKRWVNLTGTPAPNGLQDLWGQSWFLDGGYRLGRSYSDFENRWFGFQRAKDAVTAHKTFVKRVVFPHAQTEIQDKLKDICLTLDPKDWFDLDEPIVRNVEIGLPPKARSHYREMEREMFTRLEGHDIEAFAAAAKSIKCLQMANGAAYVGESNTEWVVTHDEKIDALESIVVEAGGAPILVAYHFKSDLARLMKRFPTGRALDANPKTIDQWNAGEIPILFAHPASAGHGLNLADGGNILVYFGHWWDLEQRQQILERIGPMRQKQAGHERPVFVYNIVARDTVDEVVIERVASKREVQDLLLDYMKRGKHHG